LRGKSLLQKLLFKWLQYTGVDAYSGMELCMPTWLNNDYGDGAVVDIMAVYAYSKVEVCTTIFFGSKSFSKKIQNSNGHIP
jgi:hypothetical protein